MGLRQRKKKLKGELTNLGPKSLKRKYELDQNGKTHGGSEAKLLEQQVIRKGSEGHIFFYQ